MQEEIWKDIPNYEGIYRVSNFGNVICIKNNKFRKLKPTLNKYGYLQLQLCINSKKYNYTVHKLVAIAFLNHKPNGNTLVVNHINFIKTDNRFENLEIVTNRENSNLKHIPHSSKYTGVSWDKKSKKWRSYMNIKKKKYHLGLFDNEYDAHLAYENEISRIS